MSGPYLVAQLRLPNAWVDSIKSLSLVHMWSFIFIRTPIFECCMEIFGVMNGNEKTRVTTILDCVLKVWTLFYVQS